MHPPNMHPRFNDTRMAVHTRRGNQRKEGQIERASTLLITYGYTHFTFLGNLSSTSDKKVDSPYERLVKVYQIPKSCSTVSTCYSVLVAPFPNPPSPTSPAVLVLLVRRDLQMQKPSTATTATAAIAIPAMAPLPRAPSSPSPQGSMPSMYVVLPSTTRPPTSPHEKPKQSYTDSSCSFIST